ncbi:STE3-domain-containing protein [Peniophora sp. CONT]|nr:STE3-domain-containing protein [Peniophora sp. CONT]
MNTVNPTYPLFPIASFLSAMMLLLVLLTSFIRQRWNLGVVFLCFWLLVEAATNGANCIIWSNNADVKLWVYCDIVSRVQLIAFVVKPMATLIITRRLYLVVSLQSVELPNAATRHRNLLIEWILGMVVPLLVAGPIFYTTQVSRFQVIERFGCTNSPAASLFTVLAISSWNIVPPLISITIYYPRVARIFYLHSRDINQFLRSNGSVSRTIYLRILALASLDILLTLPIGTVNVVLDVIAYKAQNSLIFYPGWARVHSNWEPQSISYAEVQAFGVSALVGEYFTLWASPVLSFTIFALFGMTAEARASYWRIICTAGGWFGWKPSPRVGNAGASLGTIEFGAQPLEAMTLDAEMGSHPSFINTNLAQTSHLPIERGAGDPSGSASSEPDREVHEREMVSENPNESRNVPSEQDRRSKSSTTDTAAVPVEA